MFATCGKLCRATIIQQHPCGCYFYFGTTYGREGSNERSELRASMRKHTWIFDALAASNVSSPYMFTLIELV